MIEKIARHIDVVIYFTPGYGAAKRRAENIKVSSVSE
jgi:hypothetical protein